MHKTQKSRLVLLLLLSTVCTFGQNKEAKAIDTLMQTYVEYDQFNGSILVAKKGEVLIKKGYGLANMEWDIPNTPDTKFRLGSITKQFTATLILQLAAAREIDLQKPMSTYLPYYRKDVGDKVTVHQLLSHTSGIPSYTDTPGFFKDKARDPYTPETFVRTFCSDDLEFEPGTKYHYNNSGYFILGAILEQVTAKPYSQLLQERIFNPLGMNHSGYDLPEPILTKRAAGYEKTPDGYVNAPYLDMTIPYAAGSLYSTVEDLLIWDRALYSEKLLPSDMKQSMFTPGLSDYGYGWAIKKVSIGPKELTVTRHGGGIHGFNTLITRYLEDEVLVVLLNNTGGTKLSEMEEKIVQILYGQKVQEPKKPVFAPLMKAYTDNGVTAGSNLLSNMQKEGGYDLQEQMINRLGYTLINMKKMEEAIDVFKHNVVLFPESANVYDSLGEAYMLRGETELAITNYEKTLELNPDNPNAKTMLEKLKSNGNHH